MQRVRSFRDLLWFWHRLAAPYGEITMRDHRIVELQAQVQERVAWTRTLLDEIANRDATIQALREEMARNGPRANGDASPEPRLASDTRS
jgi:ACT domain-containing protein